MLTIFGPSKKDRELAKLRSFKAYVHERLDLAGIPVNPPGEHADAGCRVGQRLDFVLPMPAPMRRVAREPMQHELKCWEMYFRPTWDGKKTYEVRRDDRDYRVGDTLLIRETVWGGGRYTGRQCYRVITFILRGEPEFGLMNGFAVLGLAPTAIPGETL